VNENRAKYLTAGGPPSETEAPAFTLSKGALEALVTRAVEKAVAACGPRLVDRHGIAELLGVSPSQVDALRKRGLPVVMVGQNVRFEPPAVIAWCKGSGSAAA
jgi:hypothetical protein